MKLTVNEATELVNKGVSIDGAEVVDENGTTVEVQVITKSLPVEAKAAAVTGKVTPMEKKSMNLWEKLYAVKEAKSASVWSDEASNGELYATELGQVWAVVRQSPLVSRLMEIPMKQSTMKLPQIGPWSGVILEHPDASGHSGSKVTRDVKSSEVTLTLGTKYALVNIADESMEDCPEAFQTLLPQMMTSELTQKVEADTVAELLAASGRVTVSRATSGSPVITAGDIYSMWVSLERTGVSESDCAFICHPLCAARVLALRDSFAGVGSSGIMASIAGIPIVMSPYCTTPTASGESGGVILAALSKVAMGVKATGPKVLVNPYIYSEQNLTSIKATLRVDVKPMSNVAYTRSGFTSSFYVVLGRV